MLICGVETSCDETGIALWSDHGLVGHVLHSQIVKHREHGGVVPEIAARDHQKTCPYLWQQLLKDTGISKNDIDVFAYTRGPGLVGCLLTGQAFTRGLAQGLAKPCVGIHHLEGHLFSVVIGRDDWYEQLMSMTPFVGCLFSGGHCLLLDVNAWGRYRVVGSTRDDAVGEAFDKVAKMMGLPYPGGPVLAKLAEQGECIYDLPRPMLNSGDGDMSFSGLKTAARQIWMSSEKSDQVRKDLAASFQLACVDVMAAKILSAQKSLGYKKVVLSGGVSANHALRLRLDELALTHDLEVIYPVLSFCTDNAAMIALAAWWRCQHDLGQSDGDAKARWPLADL